MIASPRNAYFSCEDYPQQRKLVDHEPTSRTCCTRGKRSVATNYHPTRGRVLGVAALALRGASGLGTTRPATVESDAAKFSATSRSGKDVLSQIDGKCPNISTNRNEVATDVGPRSIVICRLERRRQPVAKTSPIELNVTALASNALKTVILLCSRIAVISRSEHATALTHDRTSRSKDVARCY